MKPVIDLNEHHRVEGYEIPDRLREQTILRTGTCVFPWCTRPARTADCDHVIPYDQGGSTCSCNLAALCRRHHRLKTHTTWSYTVLEPGSFLWSSPYGYQFLTDHQGTRDVTAERPPPRRDGTSCMCRPTRPVATPPRTPPNPSPAGPPACSSAGCGTLAGPDHPRHRSMELAVDHRGRRPLSACGGWSRLIARFARCSTTYVGARCRLAEGGLDWTLAGARCSTTYGRRPLRLADGGLDWPLAGARCSTTSGRPGRARKRVSSSRATTGSSPVRTTVPRCTSRRSPAASPASPCGTGPWPRAGSARRCRRRRCGGSACTPGAGSAAASPDRPPRADR